MSACADIVIIGAGIAGASLAWQLRDAGRVVLLEGEGSPSEHSTGRSAAMMTPYAGAPLIRAASLASRRFLTEPPASFTDVPLTSARGVLRLTDAAQTDQLFATLAEGLDLGRPFRAMDPAEIRRLGVPITARVVAGLYDEEACDIDVDALHRGFLRGADLRLKTPVTSIARVGADWRVDTPCGAITAPIVVNAAGCFADRIAHLAGLGPRGLVPRKRTMAHFDCPDHRTADWPLLADPFFSFYVKPEATGILLSPSDATPSDPGEVWPDDMDIAVAVDRMQGWLDLPVRRPKASWSGLRSFFADEDPIAGFEPQAEGFFWYAGQGGFGIQSAPALARAAAAIVCGKPVPHSLRQVGLSEAALSPARLDMMKPKEIT